MKTNNVYEGFDLAREGKWLRSWNVSTGVVGLRECHHTLSGNRWDQLSKRCKPGSVQQLRSDSYLGTENSFENFQQFVEWSRGEVGYDLVDDYGKKWSIDKDILSTGSAFKRYSPDTCLYVPHEVNMFLVSGRPSVLPLGVYFSKARGLYVAQIKNRNQATNLGGYDCPLEAHRAWQKAKVLMGREIATPFKSCHRKLYDGLNSKMDQIEADWFCGRESFL
jgi:hypothetical protein